MQNYKKLLFMLMTIVINQTAYADDISVASFDELINSTPQNGDTIEFTDDLNSYSTIGNYFLNLDINFEGNNYYINGDNEFGGFVLNQDSLFNQVGIRNCQGQTYNRSKFAGAIFNSGGITNIENSAFTGNFVDAQSVNYGVAGAVYNLNGGTININRTLFEDNYSNGAASYGGAVANGYEAGATAEMTVSNSIFRGNYAAGSVIPEGGALYNRGNITINSTIFENNYAHGENGSYVYGGAVYNIGDMTINDSSFSGNYCLGENLSIGIGGAIYNNGSISINNTSIDGNTINSGYYGDGAGVFNDTAGTAIIKDSVIENNRVLTNAVQGEGGGVYNSGTLIVENSTLRNNYDRTGDTNDIYNASGGTLEFNGNGTTNIQSGLSGEGTLNKNDGGALNLGGKNSGYTGTFNFNSGTVNLLADSSYFNAQNTNFSNNINFNMQNRQINSVNFGNLNLSGTSNIFADVDFRQNVMDRINANAVSGSGNLYLKNIALEGTPEGEFISIPFADSVLKDYVSYTPAEIRTPVYDYSSRYNSADGNLEFFRGGFNSGVYVPAVASQLAGYFTQLETYKNVFSNLDMVMIAPPDERKGCTYANKTAYSGRQFAFSPLTMPEERNGVWFKPYSVFEQVPLKNGPDVSNVMYGSLFGVESGLTKLKKGWYTLYGAYAAYNGSHQAFDGNSIYNNGGLIGADAVFYKGKFFSAWTANVGANSAEASTYFGRDNFAMLNTGIAEKTGYNFETLERKLIIQPSILMAYTFVNTFNYTTSADVHMNGEPLHAIHIEPQLKLIGNFKNYLQPYISVAMIWNVIDNAKFQANDIYLPSLSVKPYVQYGIGVQKRWGDRVTGFFETLIRNGGRNGVALLLGLRISI